MQGMDETMVVSGAVVVRGLVDVSMDALGSTSTSFCDYDSLFGSLLVSASLSSLLPSADNLCGRACCPSRRQVLRSS